MTRKYEVGSFVVVNGLSSDHQAVGKVAIVEEHMPQYPDQRWYWVRFLQPIEDALFVLSYPHNATHYAAREDELDQAEGDDFAEPPTVGCEVI